MTYKEAWDKIRDRHCTRNHYCTDNCMQGEDCCEYAMALNAIEKQIPKKPVIEKDKVLFDIVYGKCPKCGSGIYSTTNLCCHKCGQALDWSALNNG